MSNALKSIMKQVASLRGEESAEDAWFALPDQYDDSVDYMNFTVEIQGPENYTVNPTGDGDRASPYKDGMFRLRIILSDTYPTEAPTVMFQTRVWHPQIDAESGKPCVDFLKEQWKPTSTLRDILVAMRQLLASPSSTDSVNSAAASEIGSGWEAFEKHAAEETAKYAMD